MDKRNPAQRVIARFGGQTALAALIGTRQSTVSHWAKTGRIPAKWQPVVLEAADVQGIVLDPSDLISRVANDAASVADSLTVELSGPDVLASYERVEDPATLPVAKYRGVLPLNGMEIPCYVLSNGQRVIGRTSATEMLSGIPGGGALERYIGATALKPFINVDLVLERMVSFRLPDVAALGTAVKGLEANALIEVCQGFVAALDANNRAHDRPFMTDRQIQVAIRASAFLAACAKIGLLALIDEATGYQYERAEDALRLKLHLFLEEEMRKWEKTFPDQLWVEFGRLTNWKGSVQSRPKYWGKLVMELVYDYLDRDVAQWLRDNAPEPRRGQNYHQWLSSQYGLKRLVEHIWMLIGIASTCRSMTELREKMAERFGKQLAIAVVRWPEDV